MALSEGELVKKARAPRIFFGWWTVAAGTFFNFWGSAYTAYGFSALFKPISADLGFSRAATSVASSISRLGGGLEASAIGWMVDRFGPRRIMLFGVTLFSLGLILMSYIQSLWAFYLVWGVLIGTASNTTSGIPLEKAITNWFVKKRGIALSIRWILSGVLFLPVLTLLINTQGWRMALVIGGIVMAVVGLPFVWFCIRDKRPEYYGLLPDGATEKEDSRTNKADMVDRGIKYAAEVGEIEFTLKQAIKTPAFWLLIIAQAGYGTAHQAISIHIIPFLTDIGADPAKAAAIVTLSGLIAIPARFIGGFVADRLKKQNLRFLFAAAFLFQAAGSFLIVLSPSLTLAYPFLILNYIGFGISLVLTSMIGGRYFGRKAFGFIRGFSAMVTMPIVLVGPIYTGWIYDTTGSYRIALSTLAGIFAFSMLLVPFAIPPKPPAGVGDISEVA